jgi:hypothetical protein
LLPLALAPPPPPIPLLSTVMTDIFFSLSLSLPSLCVEGGVIAYSSQETGWGRSKFNDSNKAWASLHIQVLSSLLKRQQSIT